MTLCPWIYPFKRIIITCGYCKLKNVSKFSNKCGSTPTKGFIMETPGSSSSGIPAEAGESFRLNFHFLKKYIYFYN